MELRNRIVLTPMGDDLCNPDGTVSDEQIAYAEARARGGTALVMLGSVAVAHPMGTSNKCQTGVSDDRFIPGLRRIADAVHAHGAKLGLQLTHAGKVGINDMIAGRPMWVPSIPRPGGSDPLFAQLTPDEVAKQREPFTAPTFRAEHHVMTHDDIAVAIDWFAAAVARARDAGIDGIELHAGHGYLLDEFLSPATNFRDDEYGGPVENRARFLLETLRAIRARVGDDYPVWIRINGREYLYEGTTLPDAITVSKLAVEAGADAIHVSTYADPARAIGYTESHTTHFPGHFVDCAREVKRNVSVPVIAVGRIEPELGEQLIAAGDADFIAMGRKLLADPELPNKLGADARDDVRPCMYHYRCISQIFIREGVRCAVNPSTGRELEFPTRKTTTAPRSVLVVGGGPAGMEAARLARLQGHSVVLADASSRLGGKLAYAAATYDPNADLLRWLRRQVEQLGVDVRLGVSVDADYVRASGADIVIAAIGATWDRPSVDGAALPHVLTVDQIDPWLIDGTPLAGDRVVVVGGGRAGLGLADLASRQGNHVTVVEPERVFAPQIGLVGRFRLVHDLTERGVDLRDRSTLVSVSPSHVTVAAKEGELELAADVVLIASGMGARTEAADALKAGGVEVRAVGDCTGPGFLEGAMLDAATLAVAL